MKLDSAIFITGCFLFLSVTSVYADQPTVVRAGVGNASISEGAFEDEKGIMGAVSHSLSSVDVSIGYMAFDEFKSEHAQNSYIEISAWNLGLGKSYPIGDKLGIFGTLGISIWDANATLLSNPIGHDSGSSLFYGAGVDLGLFKNLHIYGIFEYYNDISGSDIKIPSLQLGLEF
jgi:hypothetical protein